MWFLSVRFIVCLQNLSLYDETHPDVIGVEMYTRQNADEHYLVLGPSMGPKGKNAGSKKGVYDMIRVKKDSNVRIDNLFEKEITTKPINEMMKVPMSEKYTHDKKWIDDVIIWYHEREVSYTPAKAKLPRVMPTDTELESVRNFEVNTK